ncbi:hypothetical protein [Streptomyces sp. NPDC000878]
MRWVLLGVLLGLLLVFPALLALVVATVAALASQPLVVAFALGLAVRPSLARLRGWGR